MLCIFCKQNSSFHVLKCVKDLKTNSQLTRDIKVPLYADTLQRSTALCCSVDKSTVEVALHLFSLFERESEKVPCAVCNKPSSKHVEEAGSPFSKTATLNIRQHIMKWFR